MEREFVNRRAERKHVEMAAQCRTQSGLRDMGKILDITPEGCCVATNSLFFKVGTRVMIRPPGMEGLSGVVRWIGPDKAGVEFDRPLYAPIFEHLAQSHAAGRPVSLSRY
ncbi:hypothetical protein GCM10011371_13200 [Novosphingobium marinum]|uniref:PilZ domain-containing protein n=1 Tax=Novosphingobium marinum TaxID=1514948 RepID=A0A7Y9XYH0_9SPHN|nr:PilZ domain-containing protein [Novosphingobium marinum]NYH95428.1 hypothetical protein [Novosphingobium marinum]GGC26998.1 hypothetical protein GCM10011371_13200 [Novosphingobium marinum]